MTPTAALYLIRDFTVNHGFDEVAIHIERLMVEAGVMWKCPECFATYEEEQPCEFCGHGWEEE